MPRWLPVALVVLALLGVAAYGLLRPAAAPTLDPAEVQRRLDALPRRFDGWDRGTDVPVPERTVNVGRFQAFLNRTYSHPAGGAAVSVMVLYGEPGDIGAHDPTVCYAGGGWELSDNPTKRAVGEPGGGIGPAKELWSARFRKRGESLQVYWAWGVNGGWVAADNPRFVFARHPRIFKVYAQRAFSGDPPPPAADPLLEFVPKFLDRLNDTVTGPPR